MYCVDGGRQPGLGLDARSRGESQSAWKVAVLGPMYGEPAEWTSARVVAIQRCSSSVSPSNCRPGTYSSNARAWSLRTGRPSDVGTGGPVTNPASASLVAT